MAAQNYGTIGTVPDGDYDPNKQYKVGNIVTYTNGSSYLVHTIPPKGTLPTDKNYWQVSAQGGGYASLDAPGAVQPDGNTIDISNDAIISVKPATQDTLGVVKGSEDISIETDGKVGINTSFEQAAELANIIANEAWSIMLGKISKSIATTMGLDENALLKNMISNQYENVTTKAASAALVNNLKQSLDTTNSNLASKANNSDILKVKISTYAVECGIAQTGTTMPYRSDGVDLTTKSDYPAGTKLIVPLSAYNGTKYGITAITSNRYLNLNGDNLTYTCAIAYLYTD